MTFLLDHSRVVFIALFLCLSASAQTVNITGTVVDSSTSSGITGATVTLVELPGITATTASNGAFTLSGTATSLVSPQLIAVSNPTIDIKENSLTISGLSYSSPAMVDVFSSNGARILHTVKQAGKDGNILVDNLWQTKGLYYIKLRINGTDRVITSLGTSSINPKSLLRPGSSLGKTAADYTLRVTKTGYITKNIIITSLTTGAGTIRLNQDQEQTGVWKDVNPAGLDPRDLPGVQNSFGPGSLVGDPAHPRDMYVGGANSGLWKSSDFGRTWSKINSTIPYVARGTTIGVAGTTPATVWAAGYRVIYKSIDGGVTFSTTNINYDLYSFIVDPNDNNHLLSGLHEVDGVVESTDGGATWQMVTGPGFPTGGVSWYPFFINTGNAATTRKTWVAVGQNGTDGAYTTDGGAHWVIPPGLAGLNHGHGNASFFQKDSLLFISGNSGTTSQGVFRSTNFGASWIRVDSGTKGESMIWGTAKNVYAMTAWACSGCNLGTNFEIAPLPGTTWTYTNVPSALRIGPNSIAVAFNGTPYVIVGSMWDQGLWRYVEP
jgi:hypothetical protein